MSKSALGFIFAGLAYLLIGVTLGALFFIYPETRVLRAVHTHVNLVGFVMFLIVGVSYHILPRFRGKPLYSEKLAWWQFWIANIGLFGMLIFLGIGSYNYFDALKALQSVFGGLLAVSFYLFVLNMGKTLK